MKTIKNTELKKFTPLKVCGTENKKILIHRSKFYNGYDYYLMQITWNDYNKFWVINDSFKQKTSLNSLKQALKEAKEISKNF